MRLLPISNWHLCFFPSNLLGLCEREQLNFGGAVSKEWEDAKTTCLTQLLNCNPQTGQTARQRGRT